MQHTERILVAYASKHGSTAEIAERIGERLRDAGHDVDVRPAGSIGDLEPYDAVVLGSAVYMARWNRDARRLLTRRSKQLAERDVWLFSSGPVGEETDGAERWTTPKLVTKMLPRIGAHEHVVFGGRVPTDPRNFVERAMLKNTPPELQDRRDWQEIDNWGKWIGETLLYREGRDRRQG
jgi:menaquinone-dependent protoporphyrinogen oxidase